MFYLKYESLGSSGVPTSRAICIKSDVVCATLKFYSCLKSMPIFDRAPSDFCFINGPICATLKGH